MRAHPTHRLVFAVALSLWAGAAHAQSDKSQPLKGPEVTDRNVPGAAPDFGTGGAANRRFGERVPPEVFRRALGVLTTDDAAANIRATPEQREKFKVLVDDFEAAARKFRQEHAQELGDLRKAAGQVGDPRRPRAAARQEKQETENLTPEQQKARDDARAKLREIEAGAPKIEDVYTKVWADLSDPQRSAVQTRLNEWRAEQSEKRMDDYVRRQGRKDQPARKKDQPAARPAAGGEKPSKPSDQPDEMMAPKTGKPNGQPKEAVGDRTAARRDRLLRLFAQLTPEEQAQLLERLEGRLKGRRPGQGPGADRSDPKPPADPNRVNVPKPDADKK